MIKDMKCSPIGFGISIFWTVVFLGFYSYDFITKVEIYIFWFVAVSISVIIAASYEVKKERNKRKVNE